MGKVPLERDRLISLVKGGVSTCTHFFNRVVGMESRLHCLFGEVRMSSETSVSETGVKSDRISGGRSGVGSVMEALEGWF